MADTLASPTVSPMKSTPLETRAVSAGGYPDSTSFHAALPGVPCLACLLPTHVMSCALS